MKKRDLVLMNEMNLQLSKVVIFPNKCKIFEIRKYYSMAFKYCDLAHKLILESALELQISQFLRYKTLLSVK